MVGKLSKNPLVIGIYLSVFGFLGLPLWYTYSRIFFHPDVLLSDLQQITWQSVSLLIQSILLAGSVGIFATFWGSILGFILYKIPIKYSKLFTLILLIPLFLSPYVMAVAWQGILYHLTPGTHSFISFIKTGWVLTLIYTPFAMLITGNALKNINPNFEDAGLLVTGELQLIRRIVFGMIKPALSTSFILIFIFSISDFSVPAFFHLKVFTTEIFTQFTAFYKHSLAILQSLSLLILCVGLLFIDRKNLSKISFYSTGHQGKSRLFYSLKKWKKAAYTVLLFSLTTSVFLPLYSLFYGTLSSGTEYIKQAYQILHKSFINSLFLAFLASFFMLIIAYVSASSLHKKRAFSKQIAYLFLFSFAIPSIILGIGFIEFYNRPALNFIYGTAAILIIAYIGKFVFIIHKIIGNRLKQIPKSMDESAQMLSISPFMRFFKLQLPLLYPTLFSAFIIGFIFSFRELGTSIMLYPPGTDLLPIKVFTRFANAPQALINAMSFTVFLSTLALLSFFYLGYHFLSRKNRNLYD